MLGEEVMELNINSNINTDLNISNLSSGTYFIKISNKNNNVLSTLKFNIIN
jgi:uncharacterized protein YfaS (alpha-2-macroglobulin family)